MNYQIKSSNHSSRNQNKIKIIFSIIILFILIGLFAPRATSGFFSFIFSPLWKIEDSIASAEIFSSHGRLVDENANLRQELASLDSASSAIALLEQENADLKTLLGRPPQKNTILATVLKKPPFSSYDTVVIDLGSNQGLKEGDIVYGIGPAPVSTSTPTNASSSTQGIQTSVVNIPIGTVSQANGDTSEVRLYSSPGEKINIEIGPKHIPITAVGRGGGTFQVTLPREANIKVGDTVILPSIHPLLFATVDSIISDPARPFSTILFQSPINLSQLHWLMVEKNATTTLPKK